MNKDKIYKYCTLDTAIKILKSDSVILNSPNEFNDPFDSLIKPDKRSKKAIFDLLINFECFNLLKEIYYKSQFNSSFLEFMLLNYERMINKSKEYIKIPGLNFLYIYLKKKSNLSEFHEKKLKEKFNIRLNNIFENIRRKTLITCFSKRNDSTLMWAHYADKHKGICIEFNDDKNLLKKVSYRNKRYKLNSIKLFKGFLYSDYAKCEYDFIPKKYKKNIMKGFFVKQKDWKYEKELRCVLFENDGVKDLYKKDKDYFLKMKISKIFIGVNAVKSEQLDELIALSKDKNIPIIFMKEDESRYKIIPNENENHFHFFE